MANSNDTARAYVVQAVAVELARQEGFETPSVKNWQLADKAVDAVANALIGIDRERGD